jgi:cell division protein FtsB
MYLSEVEEIIAYIVCIAIVIGFVVSTYMEIKNTVAEEKEKQAEKEENEAKIKTLIHYLNSKKELIDSLAKTKKSIEEKQNKKKA